MNFKLVSLNARYIHSCLALFYIRNELDKHIPEGHTEIIQCTINDPYYPTLLRIAEGEPYAVLFSVYIWNSHYIHRLIRDLKALLPRTLIISGGPQAPHIFRRSNSVNLINQGYCTTVRGEIEGVPTTFYQDLKDRDLKAEYICDRNKAFSFPYRQNDFAGPLKNRHIYYESSRGCLFSCTYCLSSAHQGVNYKDLRLVREELGMILSQKPKIVRFVDRTFNDKNDRALDIWRFLLDHEGDTLFHFEIIPDRITDEMLSFFETIKPGRFQFEIGVQSTESATLNSVNRRMNIDKVRSNITQIAALDTIHLHVDLILGLPFETVESFAHSFNDVFLMAPHHIQMGLLKVLPDTSLSRSVTEFGIQTCESPPYEILANHWLDHSILAELYWFSKCVEAFYNNRFFRTVWAYIRRLGEDGFDFFKSLLNICRLHDFFHQSSTQNNMNFMLLELAEQRSDRNLLRELLVFDWLRSGHCYLPEHLQGRSLNETKKKLWISLPQNRQGVYSYRNRDRFFKQSVFAYFSRQAIKEIGYEGYDTAGYVCFNVQQQRGVFKYRRTFFFPEEKTENLVQDRSIE